MTALLANAKRQLYAAWPLRYSALATDEGYRSTNMESGDVGREAPHCGRNSRHDRAGGTWGHAYPKFKPKNQREFKGMSLGMYKNKTPRRAHVYQLFGGNGGIRTLDEALHPILP